MARSAPSTVRLLVVLGLGGLVGCGSGDTITGLEPDVRTVLSPSLAVSGGRALLTATEATSRLGDRLPGVTLGLHFGAERTWRGVGGDPVYPAVYDDAIGSASALEPSGRGLVAWGLESGPGIAAAWVDEAGPSWEDAALLDDRPGRWPCVALDGEGGALVVWAGGGELRSVRYVGGLGWQPYDVVAAAVPFRTPRLVMDASGAATLTWTDDGPGSGMYVARYEEGSGWSEPLALGATTGRESPRVAVRPGGAGGDAAVMWFDPDDSLRVRRFVPGTGWEAPVVLTDFAHPIYDVAMGTDGSMAAVWQVSDAVYLARADPTGTWSAPADVAEGTLGSVQVAIDPSGRATVLYSRDDRPFVRHVPPSGPPGSEVPLDPTPSPQPGAFLLESDETGLMVAAWVQAFGEIGESRLAHHVFGTPVPAFSTSSAATPGGVTVTFDATASTDDEGIVLYEWDFEGDGTYDVAGDAAAAAVVSHFYDVPSTYTVALRVTDATGLFAVLRSAVTVGAGTGPFRLIVSVTGSGGGSVDSSPAGINCPDGCAAYFASGTRVYLTPRPSPGSIFGDWTGADVDLGIEGCQVVMDRDRTVVATFAAP